MRRRMSEYDSMEMRTPITYYGGKQQLADYIIGMIPKHRVYCEPFFGGGAVFFAKGKSYLEAINDINDNLITFYEVCQDEKLYEELVAKVEHTLMSERYWRKAKEIWNGRIQSTKVERAWAVWLTTNMSFNGTPIGGWKWCNGTSGSHCGIVMDGYRHNLTQAVHERLKFVQISCRDALDVIRQRDREETFYFLDPPYPGHDQKHYRGYTYDDLEELLQLLSGIRGKFLLCNFQSDILQKHAKANGWHVAIKDMPLSVNNFQGFARRKQEVMVYNYDVEPTLFG